MITAQSLTNSSLTVIIDNGAEILTARNDHPKWNDILSAFKSQNERVLKSLLSMKSVVEVYSHGDLTIDGTGILYKNRPIHGVDVDRTLAFLNEGLPYEPYAKYVEKKMKNISARAIEQMYPFLEHKNMPLTSEGNFIAYKGVQDNYYSVMGNLSTVVISGKVDSEGHILNEIGKTIEVERSSVDDNFNNGCSFGLHAGSLSYAKGWGKRVILVEIDPADVVSVPADCNCQKLRCCKYKVIGEYTGPLPDTYTNEFSDKSSTNTVSSDDNEDEIEDMINEICEGGEKDHYTPLDPPPVVKEVSSPEVVNTQNEVTKSKDYIEGWNAGFDDSLLESPSRFLQGDEDGADSKEHKNFIMGYLVGYSV